MQNLVFNLYKPHQNQNQIIQAQKRFKVICCGRRFGKTTLAVNELLYYCLINKNAEFWYISPTYRQSKQIAWRMLLNQYYSLHPQLRGKINESELWIETSSGSRLALKGADNEDSLRGSGLDGIVVDEVASIKNWNELWNEVLRPALTDKQGWALFISTPKGFNHFYDLFNKEKEDQDYKSFRFTSFDNPYLDEEEIKKAQEELSEDAFAQEYLADFRKYTGLIYKEFSRELNVIDPIELPSFWTFERGMDFGASHPTAVLWLAYDNQDNVYVYDEYKKSGLTIQNHTNILNAKDNPQRVIQNTWGDPSAEQAILDYAGFNLFITPAVKVITGEEKGWVKSGIEKIRQLLKPRPQTNRPRLYVFRNCIETIKEFESYHWQENTKLEMPEKINDDLMDALRYAIVSHSQKTNRYDDEPLYLPTNQFTGYSSNI